MLQFADAEHIPEAPEQGPITVDNAGERLFLRCERQVSNLSHTCTIFGFVWLLPSSMACVVRSMLCWAVAALDSAVM